MYRGRRVGVVIGRYQHEDGVTAPPTGISWQDAVDSLGFVVLGRQRGGADRPERHAATVQVLLAVAVGVDGRYCDAITGAKRAFRSSIPCPRAEDDEGRHRAYNQRVDERLEPGDDTLTHRLVALGGRMSDGGRPLAGLGS